MENILSVDFELNTVAKTRKEWIKELTEYEIDCLDSADLHDGTLIHLLTNGFVGYKNMSDIALIDEIYDTLGHNYHIEETI